MLHELLGVADISSLVRARRLRWFGHVQRVSSVTTATFNLEVPGKRGRGRPRKTWAACVKTDREVCNMVNTDPLDRVAWRAGVRGSLKTHSLELPHHPDD